MFKKLSLSKDATKNPFNGLKIIATLSVTSMLFTNAIIAREVNTPIQLPAMTTTINYAPARQIPTGYVKGNYTAVATPYWKTKKVESPKTNELSLQEAAEIAAQEAFRFYDLKLTNEKIECCYCPTSDPYWSIIIKINTDYFFDLCIDSNTGELTGISYIGGPNITKLSASEDDKTIENGIALAEKGLSNPNEDCTKVKNMLTQKGFLSEPIQSITYKLSSYGTTFSVAHPYSSITHLFTVVTTSNKTYRIMTTQDLSSITHFSLSTQK